jgi:hypothetical protein
MRSLLTMALVLALASTGLPMSVAACEMAGPNTHVGTVVSLDAGKGTLTLKDGETSKNLTFVADAPLLSGVAVKDQVAVTYAQDGGRLKAKAIRKIGG